MSPALLAASAVLLAQSSVSDIAPEIKANSSALQISATSLSGPGAELLLGAIGDSKFVVIGEEHFILEVPIFSEALFRTLHREKGFNYLVVENDPYAVALLGGGEYRKDSAKRAELMKDYPNLVAFSMAQEVKLLDAAYEISNAKRPVIGVDQNIGVLHILHRLAELADNEGSKAAVAALLARIEPIDSKRAGPNSPHYMSSPEALPDAEKLRREFTTKSEEADRLIELMRTSAEVYALWRAGNTGDPTANYRSNFIREHYMKGQFSRQYKEIAAENPRIMAKFGMNHSFRGINQVGVPAIGNLFGELAIHEGSTSTGIAIVGKSQGAYAGTPWMKQFLNECSPEQNTVVDLRPIRLKVKSGQLKVEPATSRFLDGFDLLVVIGKPTPMPLG